MEIWKDIYFGENGIEWDYRGLYQVSNFGRVKSFHNGKEKILKAIKNTGGYELIGLHVNSKQKFFLIHRLVAHMFLSDSYFDGAEIDHIDTDRTNNHHTNLRWCTSKENSNNELTKKHHSEANKGKNPYAGKTDEELAEISRKQSEAMKEVWDNKSEEELAEISRKLSEANKGEKNPMYGKNPLAGKSEEELAEIRKKHSNANKGEKNGRAVLVDRFTLDGQYLDTKYPFEYVQELGFSASHISDCCKGRIKSTGGFIFKYHEE